MAGSSKDFGGSSRRMVITDAAEHLGAEKRRSFVEVAMDGTLVVRGGSSMTISEMFLTAGRQQSRTSFASSAGHSLPPSEEEVPPHGQGDATLNLLYFPDPPLVLPLEGDDEDNPNQQAEDTVVSVNKYWKPHAATSWLDGWPQVVAAKQRTNEFLADWARNALRDFKAFANVSPHALGVRAIASQGEEAMTGEVVEPGQCVVIETVMPRDDCNFLKLAGKKGLFDNAGWVFDSLGGLTLMAELVNLETGNWWYSIVCDEHVGTRLGPTSSDLGRTGWVLCPMEIFAVDIRCKVGGHVYVQLADGRGWIFTRKPGSSRNDLTPEHQVAKECEAELTVGGDASPNVVELLPATNDRVEVGRWAYVVGANHVLSIGSRQHGVLLNPGELVEINKRVAADGGIRSACSSDFVGPNGEFRERKVKPTMRTWLRLSDGRGWVPETDVYGNPQVHNHIPQSRRSQGSSPMNHEPWMMGVA